MKRLNGKTAIITGGASGIGEATVKLFVAEGAKVIIADIADELGNKVANECGSNAIFKHTDITQESDFQGVIDYVVKEFGKLDCIFNNAGIGGHIGYIFKIEEVDFDIDVSILFKGAFLGTKQAARVMREQGFGSIINMASIAGVLPGWGAIIYSACKAAVISLTGNVAQQLGPFGIRANCICPGVIPTPLFPNALGLPSEQHQEVLDKLKEIFKGTQAIPRSGMAEDVAKAALWLASDDASFISGVALRVDGGAAGICYTKERTDSILRAMSINPEEVEVVI